MLFILYLYIFSYNTLQYTTLLYPYNASYEFIADLILQTVKSYFGATSGNNVDGLLSGWIAEHWNVILG